MEDEIQLYQSLANVNDAVTDNLMGLLGEDDPEELKKLLAMFNLQQSKKNVVRAKQVGDLIDLILDGYREKLIDTDGYKLEALGDALKTLLMAADKFGNSATETVETSPVIRTNITVNNINGIELSRESRERIIEAVKMLTSGSVPTNKEE